MRGKLFFEGFLGGGASGWNILVHGSCWGGSYSLPEVLMGTFVG